MVNYANRKGGLFYSSSRTYRFCKLPCGVPGVPLTQFCNEHGITHDQIRTLFKRRIVLGLRDKGRIYVALHPDVKKLSDVYTKWKHS